MRKSLVLIDLAWVAARAMWEPSPGPLGSQTWRALMGSPTTAWQESVWTNSADILANSPRALCSVTTFTNIWIDNMTNAAFHYVHCWRGTVSEKCMTDICVRSSRKLLITIMQIINYRIIVRNGRHFDKTTIYNRIRNFSDRKYVCWRKDVCV